MVNLMYYWMSVLQVAVMLSHIPHDVDREEALMSSRLLYSAVLIESHMIGWIEIFIIMNNEHMTLSGQF